jgi:hypothetical protein
MDNMSSKQNRNDRCACNSGKKYKICCINKANIVSKMEEYSAQSRELYNICCDNGCENLVDPTNWILNQDKMRMAWEKFKGEIKSDVFMNNNCFTTYMDFMYNTYPPNFGNKIKECYANNVDFDGANVFVQLGGKI